MSYIPTNWENGKTPINAENLNKIEQKLVDLDKNGGGGGGNATVEEMTWAEYEALSEEEKMDGTLRVITDRKAGVRFGNVDISGIGDGTVTGAIVALNSNLGEKVKVKSGSVNLGNDTWAEIAVDDQINIILNICFTVNGAQRYTLFDISTHFTYEYISNKIRVRTVNLPGGTYNYTVAYI